MLFQLLCLMAAEQQVFLKFRNENAKELAEKIKYAIDNPDRMIEMGIQVRNIFEQKFSIMALEKNVNMIINGEY